jgi:hypothetical protein
MVARQPVGGPFRLRDDPFEVVLAGQPEQVDTAAENVVDVP